MCAKGLGPAALSGRGLSARAQAAEAGRHAHLCAPSSSPAAPVHRGVPRDRPGAAGVHPAAGRGGRDADLMVRLRPRPLRRCGHMSWRATWSRRWHRPRLCASTARSSARDLEGLPCCAARWNPGAPGFRRRPGTGGSPAGLAVQRHWPDVRRRRRRHGRGTGAPEAGRPGWTTARWCACSHLAPPAPTPITCAGAPVPWSAGVFGLCRLAANAGRKRANKFKAFIAPASAYQTRPYKTSSKREITWLSAAFSHGLLFFQNAVAAPCAVHRVQCAMVITHPPPPSARRAIPTWCRPCLPWCPPRPALAR